MKRPVTISADLAREICDVLASLCGFAQGTTNAVPSLKSTIDPVLARAEVAADSLRQLWAESAADEAMRELR